MINFAGDADNLLKTIYQETRDPRIATYFASKGIQLNGDENSKIANLVNNFVRCRNAFNYYNKEKTTLQAQILDIREAKPNTKFQSKRFILGFETKERAGYVVEPTTYIQISFVER